MEQHTYWFEAFVNIRIHSLLQEPYLLSSEPDVLKSLLVPFCTVLKTKILSFAHQCQVAFGTI